MKLKSKSGGGTEMKEYNLYWETDSQYFALLKVLKSDGVTRFWIKKQVATRSDYEDMLANRDGKWKYVDSIRTRNSYVLNLKRNSYSDEMAGITSSGIVGFSNEAFYNLTDDAFYYLGGIPSNEIFGL